VGGEGVREDVGGGERKNSSSIVAKREKALTTVTRGEEGKGSSLFKGEGGRPLREKLKEGKMIACSATQKRKGGEGGKQLSNRRERGKGGKERKFILLISSEGRKKRKNLLFPIDARTLHRGGKIPLPLAKVEALSFT